MYYNKRGIKMTPEEQVQMQCDLMAVVQKYLEVEDLSAYDKVCRIFYTKCNKIVNLTTINKWLIND